MMRPSSLHTTLALAIFLSGSGFAGQSSPDDSLRSPITFFPSSQIFPRLYADGTTHQFGVSKDLSTAMIYGSIGNEITAIEARMLGTTIQLGAGATVLGSMIKRPRLLQVLTVDFLVEFPVDVRLTDHLALRMGFGHLSAHYADDGIELLGKSSVNYVKDYIMLAAVYHLTALRADVYGGGHWDYHSLPEEQRHWMFQAGIQGGNLRLFSDGQLYAAIDVETRAEAAWATTQSYQCGVRLIPQGNRALRVAYTYRTGTDTRGQFFRERSTTHLVGVYLDF
jgi:hypothetical protein